MSNKRISKESDPLIPLQIKIFQSQKEYLDGLKGSTSRTIRELIDFHRQRPLEKMQVVHDIEDLKIKLKMHKPNLNKFRKLSGKKSC